MNADDGIIMSDLRDRYDMWIDRGRMLLADLKSMDDGSPEMAEMISVVELANVETGR